MWLRFWRPDYFYVARSRLLDAGDCSPFNRGVTIGFGLFAIDFRWNERRSVSCDGIHYPDKPSYRVVINGMQLLIARETLTYSAVLALAFQKPGATVVYKDDAGRKGTLLPGQRVMVTDNMVIDAVVTGAA